MFQYVRNTNQVRLFDDDGALRMPRILAPSKVRLFSCTGRLKYAKCNKELNKQASNKVDLKLQFQHTHNT